MSSACRLAAVCECGHVAYAEGWETDVCRHQQARIAQELSTITALASEGQGFWRSLFSTTRPTPAQYQQALSIALPWKDESSPSSRAVSAPVLPPTPTDQVESAQIDGLSPAKTLETSERVEKQAGNGAGLIMPILVTSGEAS